MLVLALDSATPTLVVGLARWSPDATVVLAERAEVSGNRHAELIAPAVSAVLAEAGLRPADLEAVVTGLGPGPYTGLRVGIVTAAAFADARGLPVVGVCSLDAVGDGARTVVTDARRKELYWAVYGDDGARIAGPGVDRPQDLSARSAVPGSAFVGDETFADRLDRPVTSAVVTTAGLLRAAAPDLAAGVSRPLEPFYLRRPDAVPSLRRKPVSPS